MAKKKSKVDFSKIKQFLIEKGERVGLGIAAAITVLFLLSALLTTATSSSKADALKKAAQSGNLMIDGSQPGDKVKIAALETPEWSKLENPKKFEMISWFDPKAVGESKMGNPPIFPVASLAKNVRDQYQVDLVFAPVFVYQLDEITGQRVKVRKAAADNLNPNFNRNQGFRGGETGGAAADMAHFIEPVKMVVVSATFPYREQVEMFRRSLRKNSLSELMATPNAMPKFVGLEVQRGEVGPNGNTTWKDLTNIVDLYKMDTKDGKAKVHKEIKDLLTHAPFDKVNVAKLGEYMGPGLNTPLPVLAKGSYPKLRLEEIVPKDVTVDLQNQNPEVRNPNGGLRGGLPGLRGGGGETNPEGQTQPMQIADLRLKDLAKGDPELAKKLSGEFDPFHPMGKLPPDPDDKGVEGNFRPQEQQGGTSLGLGISPMGGTEGGVFRNEGVNPRNPNAGTEPETTPKALVRFIDVGVEQGKSYRYRVRVLVANPNFGKPEKVIFEALASIPVLYSPWWEVPENVSIPSKYDYYVVDQHELDPRTAKQFLSRGADLESTGNDSTAIQIHKWVEEFDSGRGNLECGDWVIAERLIVHRGETIGRRINSDMPQWDPYTESFKVKPQRIRRRFEKKEEIDAVGVDFNKKPANIVVDFVGGPNYKMPNMREENSAVNLLVLSPEGKLIVRNSQVDSSPSTPRGRTRMQRYNAWRQEIYDLRLKATQKQKKGGFPGGFPGGGG